MCMREKDRMQGKKKKRVRLYRGKLSTKYARVIGSQRRKKAVASKQLGRVLETRERQNKSERERTKERGRSDTNRSNYYNITIMNDTVLL